MGVGRISLTSCQSPGGEMFRFSHQTRFSSPGSQVTPRLGPDVGLGARRRFLSGPAERGSVASFRNKYRVGATSHLGRAVLQHAKGRGVKCSDPHATVLLLVQAATRWGFDSAGSRTWKVLISVPAEGQRGTSSDRHIKPDCHVEV